MCHLVPDHCPGSRRVIHFPQNPAPTSGSRTTIAGLKNRPVTKKWIRLMLSFPHGDRPVDVLGTGAYVPGRVVTNAEAAEHAGVTGDWVFEKTAIRERRWAKADEATSS